MTLTERLQEAFNKRVCGTAMLPASDLLEAMAAIGRFEETIAQQVEAILMKDKALKHIASRVKANGFITTINYCRYC